MMLRISQAEQGVLCRASRWIRLKAVAPYRCVIKRSQDLSNSAVPL